MIPSTLPLLRGARITLRAGEDRDAPALFAIHADPEVLRYWSTPPWTEPERANALLTSDRAALAAGQALRFLIADPQDAVVGCVSLHKIDSQSRRAEIGFLLGRWAWGHGYATEATALVLGWAFGTLGLHRIEADTDPRNTASRKLLERLGFTLEGLLRERWIVDDEVSDTALYGLLAREWRHKRP